MASVEHNALYKLPNNEIWYTNGSTTEATTPNRTNVFGANIVSNTFDAERECWVIKFDGEVTKIGFDAFLGYNITSITIPDSVTWIADRAFYNCESLSSVIIGDGVTAISFCAFLGCYSLTSITIPDSVTSIGTDAFEGCSSLTSIMIPDGVTTIGHGTFSYCSSLTSVTIPDSVTTIGNSAFSNCRSLTSVTIPENVTAIGNYAFCFCHSLTNVTIPENVATIGYSAFAWTGLASIYCKAVTPPTIILSDDGFWGAFDWQATNRIIYVPMESVEAYQSAEGWSNYASDIVGYNF
jgi:hypothetical protein